MIRVAIYNAEGYEFSETSIKRSIKATFSKHGTRDAYVSVAVVGKKKMDEYVSSYYKKDGKEHKVLSFPSHNVTKEFVRHPDEENYFGEIILQYSNDNNLSELAAHGALHLLGIHHN